MMPYYLSPVCAPKTVPLTPNVPERHPLPTKAAQLSAFEKSLCRSMIPDVSHFEDEAALRAYFQYNNLAARSPGLFTERPDRVVYMRRLARVAEEAAVKIFHRRYEVVPMTGTLKDKVANAVREKTNKKIANLLLRKDVAESTQKGMTEGRKADNAFDRGARAIHHAIEIAEYYLDNEESTEIVTACREALEAFCTFRELLNLGEGDEQATTT